MAVVIDAAQCARRLERLYSSWRAEPVAWGSAHSLGVSRGPQAADSTDIRYAKSIALHLWLFGYEVPGACAAQLGWRALV